MILGSYDYRGIAGMKGMTDVATEFVDEKLIRRIELYAMLMAVLLKPAARPIRNFVESVINELHFAPL